MALTHGRGICRGHYGAVADLLLKAMITQFGVSQKSVAIAYCVFSISGAVSMQDKPVTDLPPDPPRSLHLLWIPTAWSIHRQAIVRGKYIIPHAECQYPVSHK